MDYLELKFVQMLGGRSPTLVCYFLPQELFDSYFGYYYVYYNFPIYSSYANRMNSLISFATIQFGFTIKTNFKLAIDGLVVPY